MNYPQFGNDVPFDVQQGFRWAFDELDKIRRETELRERNAVAKAKTEVFRELNANSIQQSLQSTGGNSLNVEGLLGVLAQPQKAGVPTVTALPDVLLSQDGELVSFNGVIYRFDGSTEPGTWRAISSVVIQDTYANRPAASGYANGTLFYATDQTVMYQTVAGAWAYLTGIMRGTISPDQKPTLVAGDANFLFYSTDFARHYRWTGTAWENAKTEDAQSTIVFTAIAKSGADATGWQLCDGTATTRSTATGGTTAVTVPDYSTAAYVKAANAFAGPAAASGTTANESTHTHADGTYATDAVSAGTPAGTISGVAVDDHPSHTHDDASSLATPDLFAPDVTGTGVAGRTGGPSATLTHTVSSSGTFAGSALGTHSHDVTGTSAAGSAHNHAPGTLELRNTNLISYYRL